MPKAVDPYSRVYWKAVDDERFRDVWNDDRALAAWLRLLVAADMAWPASAVLYHGVNRQALTKLSEAGLVELLAASRYRIHGLDKERQKRSDVGRDAINARWRGTTDGATEGVRPYPSSNTERIPSRVEPSRAEQSQDETRRALGARDGLAHIDEETQRVGEAITRAGILSAGDKQLTELDRLCEVHTPAKVQDTMRKRAQSGPASWRQLVWDCTKLLEPFMSGAGSKAAEKADREAEESESFSRVVASTKARNAELAEFLSVAPTNGLTPVGKARPAASSDEELIARDRAILEDPATPEWKREAARTHLAGLGIHS